MCVLRAISYRNQMLCCGVPCCCPADFLGRLHVTGVMFWAPGVRRVARAGAGEPQRSRFQRCCRQWPPGMSSLCQNFPDWLYFYYINITAKSNAYCLLGISPCPEVPFWISAFLLVRDILTLNFL